MEEDAPALKSSVDASIKRLEDYIEKTRRKTNYSHPETILTIRRPTEPQKPRKQKMGRKKLLGYFKRQTSDFSPEKILTCLKKAKPFARN